MDQGSVNKQLGVAGHYLIGPVLGTIFGSAVTRVGVHRLDTPMKVVVLAIVYVDIVSQPILALTPILLTMTVPETLQWFAESFVVHLLWAVVMGTVMNYPLQLKASAGSFIDPNLLSHEMMIAKLTLDNPFLYRIITI